MSKNTNAVRNLTITAILVALVIILQVSLGINIGPVSITLTLIPIAVGSLVLGPGYGAAIGFIFGIIVSLLSITGKDPGGQMVFAANPVIAWILCLLKGTAAGFLPAVVYRFFSKCKASRQLLIAFSGMFIALGCFAAGKVTAGSSNAKTAVICIILAIVAAAYLLLIHFALRKDKAEFYLATMIAPIANTGIFILGMFLFFRPTLDAWAGGNNVFLYAITGLAGINFLLEFAASVILAPAVATIVDRAKNK